MDEITIASLSPSLSPNEQSCVRQAIDTLGHDREISARIYSVAHDLVERARKDTQAQGLLEQLLTRFPLSGDEGLALMRLAESMLRVPDKQTAYRLIEDYLSSVEWTLSPDTQSSPFLKLSSLGLVAGHAALKTPLSSAALPVVYRSIKLVMKKIGAQFVLGETIEKALSLSAKSTRKNTRASFDMLGEGARTHNDADRYFSHYKNALGQIIKRNGSKNNADSATSRHTNGLSVKLSALHPRYVDTQSRSCIPAITDKMLDLCLLAAQHNIPITIDAEESERLCLSLRIIENILADTRLKHWDGFGFAVQAYQKRATGVIEWAAQTAHKYNRKIHIRLVKGAYWDQEIKKAQEKGLDDFPVFTRKYHTDINFLACAKTMLQHNDVIFPLFATHNAHTIAAILHMTSDVHANFELQKLHGMGDAVYNALRHKLLAKNMVQVCTYAPVGSHTDLLPYLVRRMLENGANSSFVNRLLDHDYAIADLLSDPFDKAITHDCAPHPDIRAPADLFAQEYPTPRKNSSGIDFHDAISRTRFFKKLNRFYSLIITAMRRPLSTGCLSNLPINTMPTTLIMRRIILAWFIRLFAACSGRDQNRL